MKTGTTPETTTSPDNNSSVGYKKVFGIRKGSSPSVHIYGQNCTNPTQWSRSQRRCYQRIKSGLAKHRGERLRFMTLTTPKEPKRSLSSAFRVLKERIKRVEVKDLEKANYLDRDDVKRYYGGKNKIGLSFNYLRVETTEGANGVFHVIYFGDYIPQRWLSKQWEDIIGARVVDIRATKKGVGNTARLARYCIGQYCAGQSEYLRYSWSWKWVFKGFVRVWSWIIGRVGVRKGIGVWERILGGERLIFENDGNGYSVGLDPPYIRRSCCGKWVDELEEDAVRVYRAL